MLLSPMCSPSQMCPEGENMWCRGLSAIKSFSNSLPVIWVKNMLESCRDNEWRLKKWTGQQPWWIGEIRPLKESISVHLLDQHSINLLLYCCKIFVWCWLYSVTLSSNFLLEIMIYVTNMNTNTINSWFMPTVISKWKNWNFRSCPKIFLGYLTISVVITIKRCFSKSKLKNPNNSSNVYVWHESAYGLRLESMSSF